MPDPAVPVIAWGEPHRYSEWRKGEGGPVRCPCGLYYPLGLALHARTGQYLVVYEGSEGADAGLLFVCTLHDWEARFTHEPPPPPPEKVAGAYEGTGV